MLNLRARSLVVGEAGGQELKEHIGRLVEREEEQMRQKLQRQQDKEARVSVVEREFVEWADRKENKMREKLSKSSKNKEDHLGKIVKKCRDHDKYIGQKYKNFRSKRKTELKEAWRKTEQLNHSLEDYHLSKHISHQRPPPRDGTRQEAEDNLAESRLAPKLPISYQKSSQQEYLPASYDPSRHQSKHYENGSREYWAEINRSMKYLKATEPLPCENQPQPAPKDAANLKLKETLARFKDHLQQNQSQRIQQLGERLQKIERSRLKKVELYKKRRRQRDQPLESSQVTRRGKEKKKVERQEWMHSETMTRERRVQDWSESTKQRRYEYLQTHLQHGSEYLEQQKIRYMKTHLAKKIAGSAIEKKLFIERLNH